MFGSRAVATTEEQSVYLFKPGDIKLPTGILLTNVQVEVMQTPTGINVIEL